MIMDGRPLDSNTILVVDDSPTNLAVVVDYLSSEQCRVLTAESAQSAINRLQYVIPDLILLDVMMPEMDGFELCRILKSHPLHRSIPVIFLTAKSEHEDIIEGFRSGGVDYVTKPFKEEELTMRIRTHLDLKNARNKIEEYARSVEDKNRRLTELLDEKNEFIGVATHDLKSPLSVLVLALDLLKIKIGAKNLLEIQPVIDQMSKTIIKMTSLVSKLLEINKLDVGRFDLFPEDANVVPVCNEVVLQNRSKAESKGIRLEWTPPDAPLIAHVDRNALSQVVENLVSNAIKYSPADTVIKCRLYETDSSHELPALIVADRKIRFEVQDHGPGIKEEEKLKVFQRFAKTSNRPTGGETSNGLGLSIARRLIREMRGDIGFVSTVGEGSTFYYEMPFPKQDGNGDAE